jgi:hypothetical protein
VVGGRERRTRGWHSAWTTEHAPYSFGDQLHDPPLGAPLPGRISA